ncbi:metal ABC transporter solute-binding protein, Zn/Mn family [Arthrobacter sp. Soil763]|uniref:metal ABC transporter solute-binding protein, Zn/Mn family n=1 Tax=Arthrobacter sp. Soil763 TaxID=1736402 RepID=UPI0006F35DF7|nr:zinc ABC transporter substrate-binding protein [Arthrobacter sp. Soil763]KRE80001.1 ABC transporter substrate-binding protein [Arthrobacter sp. Soil763]
MRRSATALLLAGLSSLLLTACGTGAGGERPGAGDGTVEVVASTSVYGDLISSIGGDKVKVTSIINRTSQDPHSYEATTQDKLAVSKAELVVENGGGYDDFLHKLAEDTGLDAKNLVNAVDALGLASAPADSGAAPSSADAHGHDHVAAGFNEHVWYSPAAMIRLADVLAARLGALEPSAAGQFRTNADALKKELGGLETRLAGLKTAAAHGGVAVTEPVPLYLLEAAGLENRTPAEYTSAIEAGSDVPPAVLRSAVDVVKSGKIRLLAYNPQTEGPQTRALKDAAVAAGVPVVDFSETMPEGKSYLAWMTGNVDNLAKALG